MKEFIKNQVLSRLPIDKWIQKGKIKVKENVNIELGLNARTKADELSGFIYEYNEDGNKKGPYCPQCWYDSRDKVPLINTPTPDIYICNKCNKYKRPANYVEPKNEDSDWINYNGN